MHHECKLCSVWILIAPPPRPSQTTSGRIQNCVAINCSAIERKPRYVHDGIQRAEVPKPNGPQGRAAEPPTGSSHASMFLSVTVGTTRDAATLLPPTVRTGSAEPHAKPPQPQILAPTEPRFEVGGQRRVGG